jgi:hypothetical protein
MIDKHKQQKDGLMGIKQQTPQAKFVLRIKNDQKNKLVIKSVAYSRISVATPRVSAKTYHFTAK